MKTNLKRVAILTLFVQLIVNGTSISHAVTLEEVENTENGKPCQVVIQTAQEQDDSPQPSYFARLLGGLWGRDPGKFNTVSLPMKLLFLAASPLAVMAQGYCPQKVDGTAICHLSSSASYLVDCSYTCNSGKTLTLPHSLVSQSSFRIDDIAGHLVPSCSGAFQKRLDLAQREMADAQTRIKNAKLELEAGERDLQRAQASHRVVSQEAASVSSSSQSCPEPKGWQWRLPLPGSASETCGNTILRKDTHVCTYLTQCKKIDGKTTEQNTVTVFRGASDCLVDGTSTLRQENCDGVLRPRQSWESDRQCANKATAQRRGRSEL